MKLFKDRQSAGQLLAERLEEIKADLILGIPRGGVVVAGEIADKLNLPLDIIVTRKIGAPGQPELALGAVDSDGEVVWDQLLLEDLEFRVEDLEKKVADEVVEIKRRENLYRQGEKPLEVENKEVILVDDGMATGSTVLSAVNYIGRHKAKVILAVPVASKEALEKIKEKVEKVEVLEIPEFFKAVGQFYYQFEPVEDKEVIQLMRKYGR